MPSPSAPENVPASPDVSSTLGVLFGYLGSEIATKLLFERFLWPQRYYNGVRFRLSTILQIASTMSLNGPLHRAALAVLDELAKNGLMHGPDVGDFLGTVFFPTTGAEYTTPPSPERKEVRNGLLYRIALYVGHKHLVSRDLRFSPGLESGNPRARPNAPIRAIQAIVRMKIRCVGPQEARNGVRVDSEIGNCRLNVYICIFISEISSVLVGCAVAAVWKSIFSALWFLPLVLKILSAVFTLSRSSFKDRDSANDQTTLFYIEGPRVHTLIEGPDRLVRDFFRHYGHPIRNRSREVFQFVLIAAMGLICPLGLVCLTWMSPGIQYCWLGTQLAVTCMFHFYRFSNAGICASTVEWIGDELINGHSVYMPWDDVCIEIASEIEDVPGVAEVRSTINRRIEGMLHTPKNESGASSAISQAV